MIDLRTVPCAIPHVGYSQSERAVDQFSLLPDCIGSRSVAMSFMIQFTWPGELLTGLASVRQYLVDRGNTLPQSCQGCFSGTWIKVTYTARGRWF